MNDMTIIEQLAIIAEESQAEFQAVLMWVCLVAMSAFALAMVAYSARNAFSRICRAVIWMGPLGCVMCIPCIVKLYGYGSTKPEQHLWRFEYHNGVTDNGSYCTNNLICAAWNYNPLAMEYTIRAAYQDLTVTNANGQCVDTLHQLPDALVRDSSHVWEVQNATNMRVVVYATYVTPPTVSTNGVYHLNGVTRTLDTTNAPLPKFVVSSVVIYVYPEGGGERVLTPTNAPPPSVFSTAINPNEETQE